MAMIDWRRWVGGALALAFLGVGVGCGDDDSDASADASVDSSVQDGGDAGPSRGFYLSSTGAQFTLGSTLGFTLQPADLATDVDMFSIHQDYYGVPWDEFEDEEEPPPQWVAIIDELADNAEAAGKPVFLTLQLVGGSVPRRYLADRAVVRDGMLDKDEDWAPECYNFATASDGAEKRDAWIRYVEWMVRRFEPRYVNIAVEMNLFMGCGDAAWNALVDVERDTYDAVKEIAPEAIVFPSIQQDSLFVNSELCPSMTEQQCFDLTYPKLARLKRDRFAISTYPHLSEEIDNVADIPSNWFTRGGDRGGERVIIAETGWNSTPAIGQLNDECVEAIAGSEEEQLAYFNLLVRTAEEHDMDLVTWWSNRDLLAAEVMTDCPCDFDEQWCDVVEAFRAAGGEDPNAQFLNEALLKAWGTMGIRSYDGTPKPELFDRWTEVRALPLRH